MTIIVCRLYVFLMIKYFKQAGINSLEENLFDQFKVLKLLLSFCHYLPLYLRLGLKLLDLFLWYTRQTIHLHYCSTYTNDCKSSMFSNNITRWSSQMKSFISLIYDVKWFSLTIFFQANIIGLLNSADFMMCDWQILCTPFPAFSLFQKP